MKKYLAELFGTFALTLVVLLSVSGQFPIATPILAALTLGLLVYTIGGISSCHINPAITIGVLSVKKISLPQAMGYVLVQLIGAELALMLFTSLGKSLPFMAPSTLEVGIGELVGTLFFAFGVATVIAGKVDKLLSGVVVGGSLLLGISLGAGVGAAGVLNPAVALGLGLFNPMYILGPIVGSILGFWLSSFFYPRTSKK